MFSIISLGEAGGLAGEQIAGRIDRRFSQGPLRAAYDRTTTDAVPPAGLDLAPARGAASEGMMAAAVGAEIDDSAAGKQAATLRAMGNEKTAVLLPDRHPAQGLER